MDVQTKNGWPQPCALCEAPVTSVIDDDIGLHGQADIVIIGGGPHARAALAALHEGPPEFRREDTRVCVVSAEAATGDAALRDAIKWLRKHSAKA